MEDLAGTAFSCLGWHDTRIDAPKGIGDREALVVGRGGPLGRTALALPRFTTGASARTGASMSPLNDPPSS
jgi:hypothetical protein